MKRRVRCNVCGKLFTAQGIGSHKVSHKNDLRWIDPRPLPRPRTIIIEANVFTGDVTVRERE